MEPLSFIEPLKQGHVFFYDLDMDEVVHFRKEIYEAAVKNEHGLDIDLTEEEESDAEDAWDIVEDETGRYEALPQVPEEMTAAWESDFEASGGKDRETFFASKMNEFVLDWLDQFDDSDEFRSETTH